MLGDHGLGARPLSNRSGQRSELVDSDRAAEGRIATTAVGRRRIDLAGG